MSKRKTPFIIAEVGSNWATLDDCIKSVKLAKYAGADAVKFQMYDSCALYGSSGYGPNGEYVEMKGQLPVDWLVKCAVEALSVGIELMCTAFSVPYLQVVNDIVSRHKIASAEMSHFPMLKEAAKSGKPILMSTGGSDLAEIGDSVACLQDAGAKDITLLYCVAAYPAGYPVLTNIEALKQKFKLPVGYSDHTTDVNFIPIEACNTYGATVLEKHVNLIGIEGTPDAPHSIGFHAFKDLIHRIKVDLPPVYLGPLDEESDMYWRDKRRVVATSKISKGDQFLYGLNYGFYRLKAHDYKGFRPIQATYLSGTVAARDIEPGACISSQDLSWT